MEKCLTTSHSVSRYVMLVKMPRFIRLRDADGETPLHCAASKGYYEGVQYLIDKTNPVNVCSKGMTMASCLSTQHQEKAIRIFLVSCFHIPLIGGSC